MNPYTDFLPTNENQAYPSFDSYACTNFSICNLFETYLNKLISDKAISINAILFLNEKGYLDQYGKVNFSDQFNGIMSNTEYGKGNYFENVIASILRDGLVPDKMFTDIPTTPQEYYDKTLITQEMKDIGFEFLKRFKIEILAKFAPLDTLKTDLLWMTINVCPGYGVDPIIKNCVFPPSHAVLGYDMEGDVVSFFDTYPEYKKKISSLNCYARWQLTIQEINQPNLNTMFKDLIREKGRKEVYAVINNKPYYIGEYAFADLLADKLVRWEDVREVDFVINLQGVIK